MGFLKIPGQLEGLSARCKQKSQEIFENISGLAETYRGLYGAVKDFIRSHPVVKDKLQLNFEVSIENIEFEGGFFDFVSQGVSGSFMGLDEGRRVLKAIIQKHHFNDWPEVDHFTEDITRTRDWRAVETEAATHKTTADPSASRSG